MILLTTAQSFGFGFDFDFEHSLAPYFVPKALSLEDLVEAPVN